MDPRTSLHIEDPWLYYIQIGIKKVEGRKGTLAKYKHWIGCGVCFYNAERKIPVLIKDIRHYPDLYSYLDTEGYNNVMPWADSYQEAVEAYHKFNNDENIELSGGMLAIVIELL
jgi:ASC-1-like (ASCH) protein